MSHALFQVTLNGMERIGVSLSFKRTRMSGAGAMPVDMLAYMSRGDLSCVPSIHVIDCLVELDFVIIHL